MYFLFHVSILNQKRGLRYWNNLMTLNAQEWTEYVLSERYEEDLNAFNVLRLNVGRSEVVNKSFFKQ